MSNQDFNRFTNENEMTPPQELQSNILSLVKNEMQPAHKLVFLKLSLTQGFIGFITMLFCPQFNISLTNQYDLFHYFHRTFGHYGCMVVCGTVFMGTGAIFASTILSKYEVHIIKNNKFLYYFAICGIFICTLMLLGAEVYLDTLGFWLFGAIVSSSMIFELNNYIRYRKTV